MQKIFFLLLFIIPFHVYPQSNYGVKEPGNNFEKKCRPCFEAVRNMPLEIQFGLSLDFENNILFTISHKDWLFELLTSETDGIAVDIVTKDRYNCDMENLEAKSYIYGELQKPVYLAELKSKIKKSIFDKYSVNLGKLPTKYIDKEIELNLLILKDNYICYHNHFFDIESSRWELLDMGFFLDSLTYIERKYDNNYESDGFVMRNKQLRFEIPFEKDKFQYKQSDIKPLYDSLRLTEYNISKITIRAYSSIEGKQERNFELQKLRAKSIVDALQKYQKQKIITEVNTSENWVQFLNDIENGYYAWLSDLTKKQIKDSINNGLSKELEPILNKHRKAVVILDLQKKTKFNNISNEELVKQFNTTISDRNLKKANQIQSAFFERISTGLMSPQNLGKLEIPKEAEFGSLLNKIAIFKYFMSEEAIFDTYSELELLHDLAPKNPKVLYNLIAIKFAVWLYSYQTMDTTILKNQIQSIENLGIAKGLVERMMLNYHILKSELAMKKGDFKSKNQSLEYIREALEDASINQSDTLRLAKYFSSYSRYDWAKELLEDKVQNLDTDEDILFYYLNLTLIDRNLIEDPDYRKIMLNAININKERFCKLFNSILNGGITFQLLENKYLRKTYCENCN
jgi:hypothetical protein